MPDRGMGMNSILTHEQREQIIPSVVEELEFTDPKTLWRFRHGVDLVKVTFPT